MIVKCGRKGLTMEDKTRLIREIENAVDSELTDTILFYMTEYRDIADYYFIADIFCHKCDYLALKIANELTEADREDEQSSFLFTRKRTNVRILAAGQRKRFRK